MSALSMMMVLTFGMSTPDSMIVVEMSTSKSWRTNAEHDLLEHLFVHLAVADAEARLRHELAQLVGEAVDVVDAVVDEVDLAAAVDLAQDHLADELVAGRGDEGADRQPGLRRGVDHADVADAGQRHVQRARDRRGAHGQHVDLGPQLLEELLLAHAEALLLVDDDQPEVLEADVALHEAVGADDDVDAARRPDPRSPRAARLCCAGGRASRRGPGTRASRWLKVVKCWSARTVVGTSTATCRPSLTALNAARRATSVLPKPTSPQTRRSIGSDRFAGRP